MEDLGNNILKIEKQDLLNVIMEKKNDMWRLAQICCTLVGDEYEVSYSFASGYDIQHYRLVVGRDEFVPSISRVYKSAIFYENEMRELFGLDVEHIKVDYHNKLYRIEAETPFATAKTEAAPKVAVANVTAVKKEEE